MKQYKVGMIRVLITFQIPPPLKFSGDIVRSCHTSASFSFQVSSVLIRCCTTQLSDMTYFLLS